MYKTDASGNVGNEFSESGSSTRVDAAFMNELMYEIINVLVAASIAPVKGTRTQLRDSINALIAASGGVPDATTATKGKVQLATDAQAITGSSTSLAIVCSSLTAVLALYAKLNSSPTFTGEVAAASFNKTSSRRWKKGIKTIDESEASKMFDAIRLVEYIHTKTDRKQYGVIAEQLVKIGLDFAVSYDDKNKPVSVDYHSLFTLAMAAQRRDRKLIKDLASRLQLLEYQVSFKNA